MACTNGHSDVVSVLLKAGANHLAKNNRGDIPLHNGYFFHLFQFFVVFKILFLFSFFFSFFFFFFFSSFSFQASKWGFAGIVEQLIQAGKRDGKSTGTTEKNKEGDTPLHVCATQQVASILIHFGSKIKFVFLWPS